MTAGTSAIRIDTITVTVNTVKKTVVSRTISPCRGMSAGTRAIRSGRSARVSSYVLRFPAAKRFLSLTTTLLKFLLPQYIAEGKTYLTIGVGCTGGRHRSVAIAEALARRLKRVPGIVVRVRHRDVLEENPA